MSGSSLPISVTHGSPKESVDAQAPAQAYHPTAAKIALLAGIFLAEIAVVGVLGFASVGSLGLLPISALVTMVVVGGIGSMLCFLKAYWAARTKEDLSFEEYVDKKCTGYTVEQATKLVGLGREIISDLMNHKNLSEDFNWAAVVEALPDKVSLKTEAQRILAKPDKRTEEETATLKRVLLIPVSWFFIQRAFKTGQGFEKGLIKFEDSDNQVIKFFEPKPIMYPRRSSHFGSIRLRDPVGADFPKGLPYIFKHVHMGALPEDFSFIKLEQFGCSTKLGWYGLSEFLMHAADWVRSELLARPMDEYDGPNHRKEKQIPKLIKKAFSKLCRENRLTPPEMKTIAQMVKWIKNEAPGQGTDLFNTTLDLLNLLALLEQHFPGQNLENRSGNEALLMKADLEIEELRDCF